MNRNIIRFFGLGIAVVALSACALFQQSPVLGDTATDKTRAYAEYVFLGFKVVWIPVLKGYRSLNECSATQKAPCYEERIYKPLWTATDAATDCMVKSTEPGVLLIVVTECLGKVDEAKLAFTQHGLAPKVVSP
jgi:hypothetical protein